MAQQHNVGNSVGAFVKQGGPGVQTDISNVLLSSLGCSSTGELELLITDVASDESIVTISSTSSTSAMKSFNVQGPSTLASPSDRPLYDITGRGGRGDGAQLKVGNSTVDEGMTLLLLLSQNPSKNDDSSGFGAQRRFAAAGLLNDTHFLFSSMNDLANSRRFTPSNSSALRRGTNFVGTMTSKRE